MFRIHQKHLATVITAIALVSFSGLTQAKDYEAGPIWNHADAKKKCPALAAKHRLGWNGQWKTTVPGKMSVCGLETLVTVYQHCNYGGYSVNLAPGKYTMAQLQALGVRNDDLSSIRVKSGYKVTAYQHDLFNRQPGNKWNFTSSDSCFVNRNLNDVVSSIVITKG